MQTTPLKLLLLSAVLTAFAACGPEEDLDGFGEEITADQLDPDDTATVAEALNSTIYDRARAYAARYPKRDGASWNGWCASLVWRFGQCPSSSVRPSAIEAYQHSRIISTNASQAPTGAIHYWSIGQFGHVGVDLNGGGRDVFMASYKLRQSWGDAIGVNSVGGYGSASGARYLGWAMDYSGCRIAGGGQPATSGGSTGPIPQTSTESDGIPGPIFWKRVQYVGRRDFGYTGPIDGVPGPNTEKVMVRITARELNRRGSPFTSAVNDGIPGSIYWSRVQTVGRQSFGYGGVIDGVPGPATRLAEKKIAAWAVNRAF